MEGTYPILICGEEAGSLTVRREGLLTVFEARCRDTGELVRLSLYGEREGYLGVLLPAEDGLRLTKRLSRQALAGFPEHPVFAGPAGYSEALSGHKAPESAPEAEPEPIPEPEPESMEAEPIAPPLELEPELTMPCLTPEPLPEDIVWRRGRLAVLRAGEPEDELVALPLSDDTEKAPGPAREIEGERYVILKAKGGRIV